MMGFDINASTRLSFSGAEVRLHGWLRFAFNGVDAGATHATPPSLSPGPAHDRATAHPQGDGPATYTLACRARQFSSFVVLVGRLSSAATLEPDHAFLVQNREELLVPLELAALPTPKAFKDAVASLSPEQRDSTLRDRV